jgi:hypothetical protein
LIVGVGTPERFESTAILTRSTSSRARFEVDDRERARAIHQA